MAGTGEVLGWEEGSLLIVPDHHSEENASHTSTFTPPPQIHFILKYIEFIEINHNKTCIKWAFPQAQE